MMKEKRWELCLYSNGKVKKLIKSGDGLPPITPGLFNNKYDIMRKFLRKRNHINVLNINHDSKIGYLEKKGEVSYNGFLVNNKPNGLGILHYPNNKYERGFFVNGKLNGIGRKNWENSDVYLGFFKQGKMCGEGIYYKKARDKYMIGIFGPNGCKN